MLDCDICGKSDIKTSQGLAGHRQFAHQQLTSGEPARASYALVTEDMLYDGLNDIERDLQAGIEQLEQRTLQFSTKSELSEMKAGVERVAAATSELMQIVRSLSALVLHLDMHQRPDKFKPPLFRSFLGRDQGIEWWEEEVYEDQRDAVLQELKVAS